MTFHYLKKIPLIKTKNYKNLYTVKYFETTMGVLQNILLIVALFLVACSPYAQSEMQGTAQDEPIVQEEPQVVTVEEPPVKETIKTVDKTPEPAQESNIKIVTIKEKGFDPQNFVIKKNMLVRFNNSDFASGLTHNVIGWKISDKTVRFQTGKLNYGEHYDVTIPIPGEYTFVDVSLDNENDREFYQGTIQVT